MTPEGWTAVGTLGLALLTLCLFIVTLYQVHLARKATGINLVLRLDGTFNGPELREARRRAAQALVNERYEEAEDVLDFFETLAHLWKAGAVDATMVWHTFFHWEVAYFQLLNPYIRKKQETEPDIYADLAGLNAKLVSLEAQRSGRRGALDKEALQTFLDDEASLPG
ncbi:MAG: hypothetical protein ACHQ50_13255 [Fimbriimonadales bacterium]